MKEEGEGEALFDVNDLKSTEFKENNLTKQKKLIIGLAVGGVVLILLIVLIIILASKGKVNDVKDKIGEIECTYSLESSETKILSDHFDKKSNFDIYINTTRIKYSKTYKFERGENKVRFVIFEDINMDNMFKGLTSLVSINFISEKNASITSMESTFENCENLINFK